MISPSLYEKYKKDTQDFIHWLANEYIALFVSNQRNLGLTPQRPQFDFKHPPKVNDLVPLAEYIVGQNQPVPYHVFSALASAIHKRSVATASYTAQVGATADPNQAASDAGHQHFTNVLTQCRHILGGDGWVRDNIRDSTEPSIERVQEELSSRFKALIVQDAEASSEEEEQASSSRPRQQRRSGKGKGKKRGKVNKGKGKQPAREEVYQEISMESLRNIDGQDAMTINYVIAVHSAAQQWIELRHCVQSLWHQVAYQNLNTAVAAASSKVAVSMVQRTNAAIFADFTGNDSYLTIVNALARGDIDNAQGTFQVEISDAVGGVVRTRTISDVKEQFLYNTYLALKGFLDDFRINRTGKPTTKLKRTLATWDPTVILANLSHDDRMTWRRIYIIKWLYDLVNVSSAIQLKKNRDSADPKSLQYVDWTGDHERTIFGLNEFAVDITRMAMQERNFQVETLIQLHHVFQLQCIVDSFTVSRGWYIPMEETVHDVAEPADLQATRDIDVFLDRHEKFITRGYRGSIFKMNLDLEISCEDFSHFQNLLDSINLSGQEFHDYLGQHVYANTQAEARKNWDGIAPSRFGPANANGLHTYSPYLCGAGLEEALSISYKQMMWLWQVMREPVLIIHMYNFLKQRGYFREPIPLWETLAILFKTGVFRSLEEDDKANSATALKTLMHMKRDLAVSNKENIHKSFDITTCYNFNRQSALSAYRKANWNPDQVTLDQSSDKDLSVLLAMLHREDLEQTPTAPIGPTENTNGAQSGTVDQVAPAGEISTTETTTGDDTSPIPGPSNPPRSKPEPIKEDSSRDAFFWANSDFLDDICGFNLLKPKRPLSSINYASVTVAIVNSFCEMEARLKEAQNAMYSVYRDRHHPNYHRGKRAQAVYERGTLFVHALDLYRTPEQEKREPMDPGAKEVLQIAADVLEADQRRIWQFTYWNDMTQADYDKMEAADAEEDAKEPESSAPP
ncbi:hypothetical protein FPOA_01846 [Fusarium poae]|uniref:DUF6604 domain-containing protein n=1 Tax=Fusarium poae TaxID=36050 RepID=A0A1B8B597_FUSPO|nr:hypothetical protein FPOA_01846 [Fusarium poae]